MRCNPGATSISLKWTIRDMGMPTQDHVLGYSQSSLQDSIWRM